jgi:PKD repeat protein
MSTINSKSLGALLILLTLVWWRCSLEKIDPSVKYDPCLGKVTAKFTYDKIGVTCDSPCVVKFTNQSAGAKTYAWNFGEGGTSTEANPTYTFKKAGKWDVKLTATGDNNCSTVFTESVTVKTPTSDLPIPDFTYSFTNNNQFAPATVEFINTSTNALSYKWNFGDSSSTTTITSPTHDYALPISCSVKLEATNSSGVTKSITKIITIKTITFRKNFTDANSRYSTAVRQTKDGGYILTGGTKDAGDVALIKTDKFGSLVWRKTIGGTKPDYGNSVQQIFDGGYIICGSTESKGLGSNDVYLIRTDINGATIWDKTFGGTRPDAGNSVQLTSDGGYIIVGETASEGDINTFDFYLLKIDNTGSLVWKKPFGGTCSDYGYAVSQTTDGGYILTGFTCSEGNAVNGYLIKTDNLGNLLWKKPFEGGERSVLQTNDGGFILCGSSVVGSDVSMSIVKMTANGTLTWKKNFGGIGTDYGMSIQQTVDGGYIACGSTNSEGNGGYDVFVVKTNNLGELDWKKTYGDISNDYGHSVQQTTDGGYVLCGYTTNPTTLNSDFYLIKTDKNGNVQ